MNRVLPVLLVAALAAGSARDVPYRDGGVLQVAAKGRGAAAVNGGAAKAGGVAGKPKPGGSVNGGKH